MSRSIHTTVKGLTRDRLTKKELDEMAQRDDTELSELAKKSAIKRAVREGRRQKRLNTEVPEGETALRETED